MRFQTQYRRCSPEYSRCQPEQMLRSSSEMYPSRRRNLSPTWKIITRNYSTNFNRKNPENFQNHRHKGAATGIKGDATPFLLNYKIFNISKTRQKLEIFVHQNTRSPRPRTVIIVTLFFFVKILFITTCWLFKSAAKKSLVTNYPFQ